jgi:hypothetical protein
MYVILPSNVYNLLNQTWNWKVGKLYMQYFKTLSQSQDEVLDFRVEKLILTYDSDEI